MVGIRRKSDVLKAEVSRLHNGDGAVRRYLSHDEAAVPGFAAEVSDVASVRGYHRLKYLTVRVDARDLRPFKRGRCHRPVTGRIPTIKSKTGESDKGDEQPGHGIEQAAAGTRDLRG